MNFAGGADPALPRRGPGRLRRRPGRAPPFTPSRLPAWRGPGSMSLVESEVKNSHRNRARRALRRRPRWPAGASRRPRRGDGAARARDALRGLAVLHGALRYFVLAPNHRRLSTDARTSSTRRRDASRCVAGLRVRERWRGNGAPIQVLQQALLGTRLGRVPKRERLHRHRRMLRGQRVFRAYRLCLLPSLRVLASRVGPSQTEPPPLARPLVRVAPVRAPRIGPRRRRRRTTAR